MQAKTLKETRKTKHVINIVVKAKKLVQVKMRTATFPSQVGLGLVWSGTGVSTLTRT